MVRRAARRFLIAAVTVVMMSLSVDSASADCSSTCSSPPTDSFVTRSYPICFFNDRPTESEIAVIRTSIVDFVRPYMPGENFTFGFTWDSRWMSLEGFQRGHTALKRAWPRVGCVGKYVSQDEYILYRRCVDYLRAFLDQPLYEFGGEVSDGDQISGQLFCDGL